MEMRRKEMRRRAVRKIATVALWCINFLGLRGLELNLIAIVVCLVKTTRKQSFNICGEVHRILRHDKWAG